MKSKNCYTEFVILGSAKELQHFHDDIVSVIKGSDKDLIYLVKKFGISQHKVFHRGKIASMKLKRNARKTVLTIRTIDEFLPPVDLFKRLVSKQAPHAHMYYLVKDPAMFAFITNDESQLIFPHRFYIYSDFENPVTSCEQKLSRKFPSGWSEWSHEDLEMTLRSILRDIGSYAESLDMDIQEMIGEIYCKMGDGKVKGNTIYFFPTSIRPDDKFMAA